MHVHRLLNAGPAGKTALWSLLTCVWEPYIAVFSYTHITRSNAILNVDDAPTLTYSPLVFSPGIYNMKCAD